MHEDPLRGKGIWIRRIPACEDGDLDAIVARARAASFTHVLLKIADGADPYNLDATGADPAAELAARLTDAGIDVWGWHSVYGDTPLFKGALRADYHLAEADRALERMAQLQAAGVSGYVIFAGGDYERIPDRARKADHFSAAVRAGLGDLPIGLAAWKYPHRHPRFPWKEFRAHCDLDLPQVFWIGAHGEAARQLETAVQKFAALDPRLPCVPTGPAFFEHNWRPAPDDLLVFFEKAIALGLPAANLSGWDDLGLTGDESFNPQHLDFRDHWQAAADFTWRTPTAIPFWLREPEPAPALVVAPARPAPIPIVVPAQPEPILQPEPEEEIEPARPYHSDEEVESEIDLAPALSFAPGEAAEDEDLPNWLREPEPGAAPELAPMPEPETPPSFAISAQPEIAAPASEEEFEPVRPYHADVEIESPLDVEPQLSFAPGEAAEPEAEELPDWLRDSEPAPTLEPEGTFEPQVNVPLEAEPETLAPEPAPMLEPDETSEPVRPYHPDVEPEQGLEPWVSFPIEPEEADLPDWLQEPEPATLAPELAPPLEPEETFEPVQPPQPAAEPEPAIEPQPISVPEEELPDWLKEPAAAIEAAIESQPKASTPTQPEAEATPATSLQAAALPKAEEAFEPMRPYYPDTEESASELELPFAFSLVVESENGDLPEWLTESEAATVEPEPEPEPIAQPEAEPAPAAAAEPAPRARPASAAPAPSLTIAPTAPLISEGDTVGRFFEALRNGKIDEAVALYGPGFSHVSPERVERDSAALREFYAVMLQHIEGAGLVWMVLRRTRLAANVQWITMARDGRPFQGTDSFHLNRDGQIIYHHTSFRPGTE